MITLLIETNWVAVIQLNPIQSNSWIDPIHVQLWSASARHARNKVDCRSEDMSDPVMSHSFYAKNNTEITR